MNGKTLINGKVAELCSQLERRAEKAERESIELMKIDFLASYIGQKFQAVINSIEIHGFKINLKPQNIEWFLTLESIPDDSYTFNEFNFTLQSHRKNHNLQAGHLIELILLSADPIQRKMEFKIENLLN